MSYISKNDLDPLIRKIEENTNEKIRGNIHRESLRNFHNYIKECFPKNPRGKSYDEIVNETIVKKRNLVEANEIMNVMGDYADDLIEEERKNLEIKEAQEKRRNVETTQNEFGEIVDNLINNHNTLGPEEIEKRVKEIISKRVQIEQDKKKNVHNEIKAAIKRLEGKENMSEMFEYQKTKIGYNRKVWKERPIDLNSSYNKATLEAIHKKVDSFIKNYIMKQHISEKIVMRLK